MIGILMLNTRFPRWPGDIGNASSFSQEVVYETVVDAVVNNVVTNARPDDALINAFVEAGLKLVDQGATVIGTSCGFLASAQEDISEKLPVPFLSSSLILLPVMKSIFGENAHIGVLTFDSKQLSSCHFHSSVNLDDQTISITGLHLQSHWYRCIADNQTKANKIHAKSDVLDVATRCLKQDPDTAALLLECTNLSPWKADIQMQTGLPVFDLVTALEWVYRANLNSDNKKPSHK